MKYSCQAVLLLGVFAIASTAQAGIVESAGNPVCSYSNFNSPIGNGLSENCSNVSAANLPADANGFQGVSLYLSGTDTEGPAGFQNTAGAVTDYEAYPDAGAAGIYGCHLSACVTTVTLGVNGVSSGTGSLASGSNIGLLGVFGLGIDPSHAGTGTFAGDPYTLSFDLFDNSQSADVFGGPVVLSGTNAVSNEAFQTADTLLTINAGDALTLREVLKVDWNYVSGDPGLIVSIPEGSLDFDGSNPNGSNVPEPSAFVLLATALAGIGALRLRRRKA
jgi:hypothetical protein